jgi:hypothetical protein
MALGVLPGMSSLPLITARLHSPQIPLPLSIRGVCRVLCAV